MRSHCDLDLEDSKAVFFIDTLAHDDALSYQVWIETAQQFRRYYSDKHSLTFLTFLVTLPLNTAFQSFHCMDISTYL